MEYLGAECQRKGVDRPSVLLRQTGLQHTAPPRGGKGRKAEEIHSRHSGLWAKAGWEQGWRKPQAHWSLAIQGRELREIYPCKKNKHPRARWEHRAETSAEASLSLPDRRVILWRLRLGQQAEWDHTRQRARARQSRGNTLKAATVLLHLYVLPAPTGQALENNLN